MPDTTFPLRCVALPILERDIGTSLETLFRLWSDRRFFPVVTGQKQPPQLMVVVNHATPEQCARVQTLYAQFPDLAACFAGLSVHSADLTGDRDLYARNRSESAGAYGNKAGPNFLFQKTMELATGFGGFTLQVEIDCLPVEAGWLEAMTEVVRANQRAWVIGSIYAGTRSLERSIQTHLNGNAVYQTGSLAFQTFLHEVWMPGIFDNVQERPNLAYDCWWSLEQSQANALSGNKAWLTLQTYGHFFKTDPFLVNLLVGEAGLQDYATVFDRFAALDRPPVFFHGSAMETVARHLLGHPAATIFEAIDSLAPPPPGRAARVRRVRRADPAATTGARTGAHRPAGPPPGPAAPRPVSAPMPWVEMCQTALKAPDTGQDRLLLTSCAGSLLLDPVATLALIRPGTPLGAAVNRAYARLGARDDAALHFDKARSRAQRIDTARSPAA